MEAGREKWGDSSSGQYRLGWIDDHSERLDNLMHNLKVERFFKEVTINGRAASADGTIKTFRRRGIKDSPPYLHDGRLLTLADTVEFFNLVLELKPNDQEKNNLVAFMRAL